MEEPNTTKSQTFIDQLIEGEILSVESAQRKIASVLSHDATVDVLTDAIRMKITDEQLFSYLTEYESRLRQKDEAWQNLLENSNDESDKFFYELDGRSNYVYSSEFDISTSELWLRKVLSQHSTNELSMANQIVTANVVLSHLCDGIDALDLCENLKSQFLELSSPSFFALSSHSIRQCLSASEVRQLTIEYAEIGQPLTQILCDLIANEGNSNRFRETCEYYLRSGIHSETKQYLQERELIPGAEIWLREVLAETDFYNASGFYLPMPADEADLAVDRPWEQMSDPTSLFRRTTIGFEDSLDADELVEPLFARLDDIYETPLMPYRGSPTSLDGLSPFECLKSLHDAGLLTATEMRGLAVQFIEDKKERLNFVLCRHFDETNRFWDFAAHLEEKSNSNRVEWEITGF